MGVIRFHSSSWMGSMPSIRLIQVSHAYRSALSLFSQVDLHLVPGWSGLVGANGAGKTTLLRLVAGELDPEEGSILRDPRHLQVALCSQEARAASATIRALAQSPRAGALRARLRLRPQEIARWPTLSAGERKRWQIGAALHSEPDVLLLDEPTNHLDGEGRCWLLEVLRHFSGIGVVVSHDRGFLDALTSHTIRMRAQRVQLRVGNYSAARAAWLAEQAVARKERETAAREARRARERLADTRRRRAQADRGRRAGRRMKTIHDEDATCGRKKGRIAQAERRLGKEVGKLRRQLARAEEAHRRFHVEREKGRSLFLGFEPARVSPLLALRAPVIRAGERPILRALDLSLERGARIHLRGANGSGKSTLLRAMLATASASVRRRVLSLPQELGPHQGGQLLAELAATPAEARGRTLSLVAALGVDPERLLASRALSPGEARKLFLAFAMGCHAWGLLLDEPSNHLDLPSIERLEAALRDYPGALLLVTHDDALAAAVTRDCWRIVDERVRTS
jgi:ATPase subunit of ABC transporter with duplicated ATPase domains